MAQYDVDIQLAIRNKNALQGLQRELNAISDAVDAINNKSIDVTGKRRQNAIEELYKNVESASLKALEKVDKATTNAHKNQQKVQLKLEDDVFNDKLDKVTRAVCCIRHDIDNSIRQNRRYVVNVDAHTAVT